MQATQAPAATPAPQAVTPQPAPVVSFGSSPKQIYDALRNASRVINIQLDEAQGDRREIASQLRQPNLSPADVKGLEARLATLDARIASLDKQKSEADQALAKQAAVPGSVMPDPPRIQNGPPEEVFFLVGMFIVVVLLPLTIAYARRLWRRNAPPDLPREVYDRFTRIEQSLDTIAIEMERVGEGQRFLTRMQAQQSERALGAGSAQPVEAGMRQREGQHR